MVVPFTDQEHRHRLFARQRKVETISGGFQFSISREIPFPLSVVGDDVGVWSRPECRILQTKFNNS